MTERPPRDRWVERQVEYFTRWTVSWAIALSSVALVLRVTVGEVPPDPVLRMLVLGADLYAAVGIGVAAISLIGYLLIRRSSVPPGEGDGVDSDSHATSGD